MTAAVDQALIELRNFGLGYLGTHLKSPWPGHKDLAVGDVDEGTGTGGPARIAAPYPAAVYAIFICV